MVEAGDSLITEQFPSVFYKKIDIIIPAYNEEKRIPPVLNDIISFISSNGLNWKIIVPVDGNDGTEEIVKKFSLEYNFIRLDKSQGRNGKGAAIKRSLKYLDSDYTILMDADNSIKFSTILEKIPLIETYDTIILSRYSKKNYIPFVRRFFSRGFNVLVRAITGLRVSDTQTGYKIFKTEKFIEAMKKVGTTNGFYEVPLLYYIKREGGKIVESDAEYKHDDGSKFHPLGLVIGDGVSLLAFAVRHSRFYKYVPDSLIKLYYRKIRWM